MINKQNLILSCLVVFAFLAGKPFAYAQQTAKGTVVDETGLPVPGAAVIQVGSVSNGTVTGPDGEFTISVPNGAQLEVSCIGYANQTIKYSGKELRIVLTEDAMFLDEVVVIGYGVQKKEYMTSSVVSVTSKDLQKAPQTNVSSMLAGKLPGITAVQTMGTPGADHADIIVRGFSTYGSDNRPLYIIDGMESGQMVNLNPSDIESISVLKDAAAASVYGVRGANGVIIITTKQGSKAGKATVSYDGSYTISKNFNEPELLNAEEYVYWYNLGLRMNGKSDKWTPEVIQSMKDAGIYADTDWRSLIYNDFGTIQQHNLSVNGGSDKVTYFGSIGYMDQVGTVKNTGYDRFNIRGSFNAKITDELTFSMNMSLRKSDRYMPGYDMGVQAYFDPIQRANYMIPIISNTYTDPETGKVYPLGMWYNTAIFSPDSSLESSGYQTWEAWDYAGRGTLEYAFSEDTILKGLKLSMFAGLNFYLNNYRQFMQSYELYGFDYTDFSVKKGISEGITEHSFCKQTDWGYSVNLRPQITYDRSFGKHNITFLGLFERTKYYSDGISGYKRGYATTFPVDISLGTVRSTTDPDVYGWYGWSGNAGFVGRLSYNYDGKYLVEASVRREASYKFAPENRWGTFPSISLGWNISKEDFMARIGWIDNLKLRASVGQLGSSDVDPYLYQAAFKSSGTVTWVLGDSTPVYGFYNENAYIYSDLTWSHTTAYNVGFDLAVLRNKLSIEADVFYKYTDKILEASGYTNYSSSLGGAYPNWMNTGTMDDRGFEFSATHTNFLPSGFNYTIRGTLAWSRNKVLSRYITDSYSLNNIVIGRSLNQWYGFQTERDENGSPFFNTQEQVDNAPAAPAGAVELGALRYVDQNGDGQITRDSRDYVWLGYSQIPEMNGSVSIDLSYGGFALSALFYGVTMCNYPIMGIYSNGHSDGTMFTRPWYGAGGNAFKHVVENSWLDPDIMADYDPTYVVDNSNARYPRMHNSRNANNDVVSDWWIVDGSYIRLKNLQLSYTLPQKVISKLKVSKMMVYLAGTNLWTLSHYKYLDPENPGVNNGYYPQQHTYSLGVNMTF